MAFYGDMCRYDARSFFVKFDFRGDASRPSALRCSVAPVARPRGLSWWPSASWSWSCFWGFCHPLKSAFQYRIRQHRRQGRRGVLSGSLPVPVAAALHLVMSSRSFVVVLANSWTRSETDDCAGGFTISRATLGARAAQAAALGAKWTGIQSFLLSSGAWSRHGVDVAAFLT
jgi:hypothetical protein